MKMDKNNLENMDREQFDNRQEQEASDSSLIRALEKHQESDELRSKMRNEISELSESEIEKNSGAIKNLAEKFKKSRIAQATLIGLSLAGATPAFGETINNNKYIEATSKASSQENERDRTRKVMENFVGGFWGGVDKIKRQNKIKDGQYISPGENERRARESFVSGINNPKKIEKKGNPRFNIIKKRNTYVDGNGVIRIKRENNQREKKSNLDSRNSKYRYGKFGLKPNNNTEQIPARMQRIPKGRLKIQRNLWENNPYIDNSSINSKKHQEQPGVFIDRNNAEVGEITNDGGEVYIGTKSIDGKIIE